MQWRKRSYGCALFRRQQISHADIRIQTAIVTGRNPKTLDQAKKILGNRYHVAVLPSEVRYLSIVSTTEHGQSTTSVLEQAFVALGAIWLPQLVRPTLGPEDLATLELAQFDLKAYAYCSVAFVCDLLSGLLTLAKARNVAATNLAIRSLYEWTMQASYVDQRNREPLKRKDFNECRKIMNGIQAGNSWAKRHGGKYPQMASLADAPDSVRIKHFVKAYKEHQIQTQNQETVEDDYGYLSEVSHPNGCLLAEVSDGVRLKFNFVCPTYAESCLGIAIAALIDWLWCLTNILGLAQENLVKNQLLGIIGKFVNKPG